MMGSCSSRHPTCRPFPPKCGWRFPRRCGSRPRPPLVLPPPRPLPVVNLGVHRPERRLKPGTALLLRAALEILVTANGGTVTHRPEADPLRPPPQP